jgi:hypothetical protein
MMNAFSLCAANATKGIIVLVVASIWPVAGQLK